MQRVNPLSTVSLSKTRRRVPDQLRKRAAVSCDYCKIRRRKCVQDSSQRPCKLCRENNVECGSTIPRKPRNYTTADNNISHSHYHAMEDLVSKLFPGVSTEDTEELIKLSKGVENDAVIFFRGQSPSSASGVLNASNPASCTPVLDHHALGVPESPLPSPLDLSESPDRASLYEQMLQHPSGALSYFGPSSSMAYVRKMRELLLALGEKRGTESLPDTQQRLCDNFIQDKFAHTMGDNQDAIPDLRALDSAQQVGCSLDMHRPKEAASARLVKLLEILPSKEETEDLIELFFVHVHVNIPLFHRSSFQAVLDRMRSPDTGAVDAGWAVCFRLVLAFSCEWRLFSLTQGDNIGSTRLASLRKRLVSDSLAEIPQLMLSATLQSVAALALFSVYLSFANERNAAWILSGCAIRMAIGLGLHQGEGLVQRSNTHLALADTELRKQIWCSLYIFEQYSSSLFGRPSAVDGIEFLVDLPNESILDQGFYQPPGLLYHEILLARIISKIRGAQIGQSLHPSNGCHGLPDVDICKNLLKELDSWEENLPSFLKFDESKSHYIYPNHFRQIVMTHVRYQYARTLLSRPFLLKALYISHALKSIQPVDERITKYKHVCFLAASASWTLIRCLWQNGQYNARLWLDGVFAYQCTLVLSLYMLDSLKMSDCPQHEKLQQMVEQMQEVLQKGPGNRTMTRLAQISLDFTKIVSSVPLDHRAKACCKSHGTSVQAAQDGLTATHNQCDTETNLRTAPNTANAHFFNWEALFEPDWFHRDLMDGYYRLDTSMSHC